MASKSSVELTISIASSLCNVLLKGPKADDALLLNRQATMASNVEYQLTSSILTTPLVALKKRGFNVDRLLNQQREQRLRSQAEASRESNSASLIDQQPTTLSDKSSSPAGQVAKRPESTVANNGTSSSIMDQVAKRNPFMPSGLKGKLPSIGAMMDNMPGAFNSKRASDQSSAIAGIPPSQQSTKQVCHLLLAGPEADDLAQYDGGCPINRQDRYQYV